MDRNPEGLESAIPGGKSHEFIELVNLSSDTFVIDSLSLTDGVIVDSLISRTSDRYLIPGDVVLILDPDYENVASHEKFPIDTSVVKILFVSHTSICGGLTEEDGFALLYGNEQMVLSLWADTPYEKGKKLTFTSFDGKDSDSTTLQYAIDKKCYYEAKPTVGVFNYLSAGTYFDCSLSLNANVTLDADLRIQSFRTHSCTLQVLNESKTLWEKVILPGEILEEVFQFEVGEGEHYIYCKDDTLLWVDTLPISSHIYDSGALYISEIAPREQTEWLELYNSGSRKIDLTGYRIVRGIDTTIIPSGAILPGEYRIVSSETDFLPQDYIEVANKMTLDNYEDTVLLISSLGVVDSLSWNSDMYAIWDKETLHRREAFQREVPVLCKPSPGASSSCIEGDRDIHIVVNPKLFSPNGDGVDDVMQIQVGRLYGVEYEISIFSLAGELQWQQTCKEPDTLSWNGIDRYGRMSPRGPYIVLLKANNTQQKSEVILWR